MKALHAEGEVGQSRGELAPMLGGAVEKEEESTKNIYAARILLAGRIQLHVNHCSGTVA
jgi:hypothetical protein